MRKYFMLMFMVISLPLATQAKPLQVITTFTVIQDIAQNVAGDAAKVESVTTPGAEIHEYQVTPRDIVKAQSADIILWNGLNLEAWFERFFASIKDRPSVLVTQGIEALNITEGDAKGAHDPHAWMSPSNALIYVENIRQALVKHDPDNAEVYNRNAENYAAQIKSLDQRLRGKINAIPEEKRWLVTSEGAFNYLAKDYGFKTLYLWAINTEEQGSPRQVQYVIDQVRKHNIPVVFSESTISDRPIKQVARETGAKYGGVLYVDSLSLADGPVPTYLDLLETTIGIIIKGFE